MINQNKENIINHRNRVYVIDQDEIIGHEGKVHLINQSIQIYNEQKPSMYIKS
jgi:predicted amidohydrolase